MLGAYLMGLTFVPKNSRVIDTRDIMVCRRVSAVQVCMADTRCHHLNKDFICAKLTRRDLLNGPFPFRERSSGDQSFRFRGHGDSFVYTVVEIQRSVQNPFKKLKRRRKVSSQTATDIPSTGTIYVITEKLMLPLHAGL